MDQKESEVWYELGFRQIIEDHLVKIIEENKFREESVTNNEAYRFEGDFYGLLNHLRVPTYLWWINLRINGLTSSFEFDGLVTNIRLITESEAIKLKKQYSLNR